MSQEIQTAEKNQKAVQTARQTVINLWGDNGAHFLTINSAQGWTKAASRLARSCSDYARASKFIVLAILDRLENMRSGKSLYLEPGITDIQAAIALSKTLPPPLPATQAQLCEHGVQLNNLGLLEPLSKELESPDSNDNSTFAWAPNPRIPALPPAMIEELDEGDASCSEDNDETNPPNPSPSTQGPTDGNDGTLEHVSTNTTAAIQGSASGEDGSAESSSAGGTTTTTTQGLTKGTGKKPSDKRAKARRKYKPTTQHSDEVASSVQGEESDIEIDSGSGVEPSAHFSNHDINAATILEDIFAHLGYNVKQKLEDLSSKGHLELDGVFSWWYQPIYKGLSLIQLAALELKIYLYHHGNDDSKLQSFQYGSLQQLLETDPVLWLLNVCLQKGKPELVALPQPMTSLSGNSGLPFFSHFSRTRDRLRVAQKPEGYSWVHFSIPEGKGSQAIFFQPSLHPLIQVETLTSVGKLTTEKQLQSLRANYQPVAFNLMRDEVMRVSPWKLATSVRGSSPRADAVLLQRPYTDLEVQAEINILLGNDRARAWQFIEQWRVFAIENLRHHFDLWLYIEKQIYQDDSYQLKFEPFSL